MDTAQPTTKLSLALRVAIVGNVLVCLLTLQLADVPAGASIRPMLMELEMGVVELLTAIIGIGAGVSELTAPRKTWKGTWLGMFFSLTPFPVGTLAIGVWCWARGFELAL